MARAIALTTPTALGLSGVSFREPFHADGGTTVHSGEPSAVGSTRRSDAATRYGPTGHRTGQEVEQVVALPNRPTIRPHATRHPRRRATAHLVRAAWARPLTPWSWFPSPVYPRRHACALSCPRPLPRTRWLPNLVTDGLGQGRLRVYMSRATVPLRVARRSQTVLTRSGSHRYSCGPVRGGHPHFRPHTGCRCRVIRRLAPVWRWRSRLRRAGPGTGRLGVLPGRSAGTRCRGSRCTGRAARCGRG